MSSLASGSLEFEIQPDMVIEFQTLEKRKLIRKEEHRNIRIGNGNYVNVCLTISFLKALFLFQTIEVIRNIRAVY